MVGFFRGGGYHRQVLLGDVQPSPAPKKGIDIRGVDATRRDNWTFKRKLQGHASFTREYYSVTN